MNKNKDRGFQKKKQKGNTKTETETENTKTVKEKGLQRTGTEERNANEERWGYKQEGELERMQWTETEQVQITGRDKEYKKQEERKCNPKISYREKEHK